VLAPSLYYHSFQHPKLLETSALSIAQITSSRWLRLRVGLCCTSETDTHPTAAQADRHPPKWVSAPLVPSCPMILFIGYYPAGNWLTRDSRTSFWLVCEKKGACEALFVVAPFIAEAAELFDRPVTWGFLAPMYSTIPEDAVIKLGGPACLLCILWVSFSLNLPFFLRNTSFSSSRFDISSSDFLPHAIPMT
jgi:hypothetical protein